MMTTDHLYDDALTILDALLDAEDDFEKASRLNACMIELAILKHKPATVRLPYEQTDHCKAREANLAIKSLRLDLIR